MSEEQVQRIKVIENAVEGRITVRVAAEYLNLSERQVKRLKRAHDEGDAGWVKHSNEGRLPLNAVSAETRQRMLELACGKYGGFNDSHLHEKLTGVEGLVLSRSSVRRILREAGLKSPQKRRPQKYRSRREPREQEGMLPLTCVCFAARPKTMVCRGQSTGTSMERSSVTIRTGQ